MAQRDDISNMGMSADARTFMLTAQIPEPQDGMILYLALSSPYPFEVIEIHYQIDVGEVQITPQVGADPIDTDQSDSSGTILVDQPTAEVAVPDGSISEVGEGEALILRLENPSTDANGLVVQFTCRRTIENVVVSE